MFAVFLLNNVLAISATALVLVAVLAQFLAFIIGFAQGNTTTRRVLAIYIAANLAAILLLFANLYRWLGITDASDATKGPATFLTALYYSVSTWTTLTYGDVVPNSITRPIAAFQALTGYVVMAFLVAVIISKIQDR
mgnify:CR=1 FL=1